MNFFEALEQITKGLDSRDDFEEKVTLLNMAEAYIKPKPTYLTKTINKELHPIQEGLIKISKERDINGMSLRQIGLLLGDKIKPQQVKHHLGQLMARGLIEYRKYKISQKEVSQDHQD